jgi:hypothetical protein
MLVANLIGKRRRPVESIDRIFQAFDGRVLTLPPNEVNTVAIAAAGPPIRIDSGQLRACARRLRTATGLNLLPTVTSLGDDELRL